MSARSHASPSKRPANLDPARIGDDPAATSAASETINLESRITDDMNMMTAIKAQNGDRRAGANASRQLLDLVADYKRLDAAAAAYLKANPDADNEEFDAVVDPLCAAIRAVVNLPAATLSDLALKISVIEKEDQFKCVGTEEAVIADIRRLAIRGMDACASPMSALCDSDDWRHALTELRRATIALRAHEANPKAKEQIFGTPQNRRYEARTARLGSDCMNALRTLMETPAPNLAAVSMKLEALQEHEIDSISDAANGWKSLRQDIDRVDNRIIFAKAWLERWKSHGGSVTRDIGSPDKLWFGHMEFFLSPDGKAFDERTRQTIRPEGMSEASWESITDCDRTFCEGAFRGAMRELLDLLDSVPDGKEAVKAIIRNDPSAGLPLTAASIKETMTTLRDFLAAGFRVFITPQGEIDEGGSMPKEWFDGERPRQIEIERAGRAFAALRRRPDADKYISRIIRMLGDRREASGFVVLASRKESGHVA